MKQFPPDNPSGFTALLERPECSLAQDGRSSSYFLINCATTNNKYGVETFSYNILEYISDYEPDRAYRNYVRNRCRGTAHWILDHDKFLAWFQYKAHPCIWLSGKSV